MTDLRSPDRRADEMFPVAAGLAIAVDEEDSDEIAAILTPLSKNQLYALAVVLAAHVDPEKPFVRADIAGVTKRAVRKAADLFQVGVEEVLSGSRFREVATARQVAYYAAHLAGDSYSQIGRVMNRDHTTVISGAAHVEADPRLRECGRMIAASLGWDRTEEAS